MRYLKSLVVIETVALVALLAAWSQRATPAPPPADRLVAEGRLHTAAHAADADVGPGAAATVPQRTLAPATGSDAGSAIEVVLHGRLVGAEGPLPADDVRFYLLAKGTWRQASVNAGGGYAVAGLRPGTWLLRCEVPGYRRLEFEHTLLPAPVQELDLQLVPAQTLAVHVRTRDGRRLYEALAERKLAVQWTVIPTEAPRTTDFPATTSSVVGDIGAGRFHYATGTDDQAASDAADGTLELDRDPPLHAALVLRHLVLAQQPIARGQTELRFAVDLDDVLARFASLRMRVLAPDGTPKLARVSISSSNGSGTSHATDEHGVLSLDDLLPGLARFEIAASDAESYQTVLAIPAGGQLDLGDIQLAAKAELPVRAVDEQGRAVQVTARWMATDLCRPPHGSSYPAQATSDGDGSFKIWSAGRRRYSVHVTASGHREAYAVVDGRTPNTEPFELVVRPAHRLTLAAEHVRCALIANEDGDALVALRLVPPYASQTLWLPDGDYQLVVYGDDGREIAREALVMAGGDVERELP